MLCRGDGNIVIVLIGTISSPPTVTTCCLGTRGPGRSSLSAMATISLYASVFSYGKDINTCIHPPMKLLSRINELVFGLVPVIE